MLEQIIIIAFYISFAMLGIWAAIRVYRELLSYTVHEGVIVSKHHRLPGIHKAIFRGGGSWDEAWIIEIKGIDSRGTERYRKLFLPKDQWQRLEVGQVYSILMTPNKPYR